MIGIDVNCIKKSEGDQRPAESKDFQSQERGRKALWHAENGNYK